MKKRLTTEEMEQFLIDYGICSEDFWTVLFVLAGLTVRHLSAFFSITLGTATSLRSSSQN